MKTRDISNTPVVRRYGVRGAKLFAKIWFSLLYVFLTALATGAWIASPEWAVGWRRVFISSLAAALIVTAASLLTRMRLNYVAAIEDLETRGRAA
jgi:hypothetical protein